jgi:hypothetical protein
MSSPGLTGALQFGQIVGVAVEMLGVAEAVTTLAGVGTDMPAESTTPQFSQISSLAPTDWPQFGQVEVSIQLSPDQKPLILLIPFHTHIFLSIKPNE